MMMAFLHDTTGQLRWHSIGLCLASLLIGVSNYRVAADVQIPQSEMVTTHVLQVQWSEVVLAAGSMDGLAIGTTVTLLRQGEAIVHPVTNKLLGTPQEPVGTVQLIEVEDHQSRGRLTKAYSEPMVGDLAEYERHLPGAPSMAEVIDLDPVVKRMEILEARVEKYEKTSKDMKSYPSFARRVLDELSVMRSYLAALDERLGVMEDRQIEEQTRLKSVREGERRPEDYKELTLHYTPETQLKLQAAGNTVLISVVRDTLHMEQMVETSASMAGGVSTDEEEEESSFAALLGLSGDDEEEPIDGMMLDTMDKGKAEPWYKTRWHLAGGVGLVVAFVLMVALVMRKRYNDVMDDLEEFQDDYFDDEDEDEFDDEDDELSTSDARPSLIDRVKRALFVVATALLVPGGLTAEMHDLQPDLHYVIKVTPTLVYIDAPATTLGEDFVILREGGKDSYMQVGEVRVIRVFVGFAIAEIVAVEADGEIEELNRAVSMRQWKAMAHGVEMGSGEMRMARDQQPRSTAIRFVHLFTGVGLNKESDLVWTGKQLTGANSLADRSVGIRFAKTLATRWRLNLTYRLAGEPIQSDADVTQLAVEIDAHYMPQGVGMSGPYIGFGGGIHQLTWNALDNLDDSTHKLGFESVVGVEIMAGTSWSLFAEGGYQYVLKWGDVIDASNIRIIAGLGRRF